jgi:hypothetical protein
MRWGRAPGQGWGGRLGGAVSRVAICDCDALRQCVGRYRDERPAMPRWENLFHNDDAGIFRSSGQAWFRDIHKLHWQTELQADEEPASTIHVRSTSDTLILHETLHSNPLR